MKQVHNARIVGHTLFNPDPKDTKVELVKLTLEILSPNAHALKRTKGVLVIGKDEATQFALGRFLQITVVDSQQVLEFPPARSAKSKPAPPAQGSLGEPEPPPPAAPAGSRGRGRTQH